MGRLTSMCFNKPVADPEFPRGGGANPPGEVSIYDFDKFSEKLHEIERIWTPWGGGCASPQIRQCKRYIPYKMLRPIKMQSNNFSTIVLSFFLRKSVFVERSGKYVK